MKNATKETIDDLSDWLSLNDTLHPVCHNIVHRVIDTDKILSDEITDWVIQKPGEYGEATVVSDDARAELRLSRLYAKQYTQPVFAEEFHFPDDDAPPPLSETTRSSWMASARDAGVDNLVDALQRAAPAAGVVPPP